jgi:hypothetical protein
MVDSKFDFKRYYNDLARLFKAGPVVRQRLANKVAAPGQVGVPVGTARAFLSHTNNSVASAMSHYGQYNRLARYSDYSEMETMAELASALDIYADEICAVNDDGQILKIDSTNTKTKEILKSLFYDTLNIEFNAHTWMRNLCKYGDYYLLLDHHPDYGILNCFPLPVNELEREEGYDKEDPLAYRYRWVTQGNRILQNWEVIHFRLLGTDNFLPYGMSVLEPARRVWRQLILMEDAVMVYRIVRSPERRVFYIDVGNIAPHDVPAFMEKAKTSLKRSQIVDNNTGRVDLRYNPLSTDEDYFIPVRGDASSRIDSLPGGQFTGDIDDLMYIQNKLFAALKIPKSYLGYESDIGAKSTLSQLDVRFARTIKRMQRVFIAELNKIAAIHLYSHGLRGDDLLNFEISMASPSMISDLQRLELWRTKFEVASMAQDGTFDKQFIYDRLFKLSKEEVAGIEEGKRKDKLFELELESIQLSGVMPVAPPPVQAQPPGAGGGMPAAPLGSPDAGLPPPPGQENAMTPPTDAGLDTASKDPMIQAAAPNELTKVNPEKKPNKSQFPDLKNYVFNMEKTALDPKRNASELTRMVRAPFGESKEKEDGDQDEVFTIRAAQLRKFAEDLQNIPSLNIKTKKLISE